MKAVSEMTIEELKAEGQERGIKSWHLMSDDTLIGAITEARKADEPPAKPSKKKIHKADKEFALIEFSEKSEKTDPNVISVGVNGAKSRFKRGVFVPVNKSILHALKNAKKPVTEPLNHDKVEATGRAKVKFVQRFPYTLHTWLGEDQYREAVGIAKYRDIEKEEMEEFRDAM